MVGVFAGLKWRLVTSRIRAAHGSARGALIAGSCASAVAIGFLVAGLVVLRIHPAAAVVTVSTLFTAQFLAWGLMPLVAFGVDETVDPAKFALLPIPPPALRRGLLVTALIGYLPLANAVVLLGAAVALSTRWWMLAVALPCVAIQLLLCVLFSRTVSTAMSTLMAGRRGRDLGVMVGFGVFVVYLLLSFTLNRAAGSSGFGAGVSRLSGALGWGPNGALAQLPSRVADGSWAQFAFGALIVLVTAVLLWRWWDRALELTLSTVASVTTGPAASTFHGVAVATSTAGTVRLVIARDRLLAWRDPMRRVPWLIVAFLSVGWPLLAVPGKGAVFGVALSALVAGTQAGNQYGTEGSALWLHMVAFADLARARGEALGHAAFTLIPGSAIVVLAASALAVLRDAGSLLPSALGVCLAALGGSAAAAGYLSAKVPIAVRQSRKSMFAGSIAGQKGRTAGVSLAIMAAGGLGSVVPVVLALLAAPGHPGWAWVALCVGPLIGLAAVLVSAGLQARIYLANGPSILSIVSVGDRS